MLECCIVVSNDTPRAWKVKVIELGFRYWWQDEEGEIIGDETVVKHVNIGPGQSDNICTRRNDRCVRLTYTIIKVLVDEEERLFAETEDTGSRSECFLEIPYSLGPQTSKEISREVTSVEQALNSLPIGLLQKDEIKSSEPGGS